MFLFVCLVDFITPPSMFNLECFILNSSPTGNF